LSERRLLIMLPGPTNVPDRVTRAMVKPMIGHRGPEFHELHKRIIENLKYVFQTRNDVYVLTSSGTGGVMCAVGNLVAPGDKVIVPTYGVFSERMRDKVKRRGGKVIEIPVEWGRAPTAAQIEDALRKEKDVKVVAIVYNETSTGVTVRELPEISKVVKEYGALLIADAISILGGDDLPVDKWNVDVCITGSQKCLACPPGLAIVSVSEEAWEAVEKNPCRPYYFDLMEIRRFYEEKVETPFTPAVPLFFALDEALQIIREEGLEKRFKRHATCAAAFYRAFEALGLSIYPKEEKNFSNTVLAANLPEGVEDGALRGTMKERYGILIAGGMGKLKGYIFRVGCMGIISESETLTTISALENTLKDLNYPVKLGAGLEAAKEVFRS